MGREEFGIRADFGRTTRWRGINEVEIRRRIPPQEQRNTSIPKARFSKSDHL